MNRTLPQGAGETPTLRRAQPVEQVLSDVDRGPALLGGHLLDQLGQPYGEISCKICEPLGATKRSHSGDYLSNGGIAGRRDLIA